MTDLSSQTPVPLEVRVIQCDSRSHHKSHYWHQLFAVAQGSRSTKILFSGRTFQGLRSRFLGDGQGPVLSLDCTGFEHPRPVQLTFYCTATKDEEMFEKNLCIHQKDLFE